MHLEPEKNKTPGARTAQSSAAVNTLASDPELLGDFILESREHLTSIELQLLALDQDPTDSEAIHAIFRGFHTIKGMAGFLDQESVRDVAHEVETILDLARTGQLAITGGISTGSSRARTISIDAWPNWNRRCRAEISPCHPTILLCWRRSEAWARRRRSAAPERAERGHPRLTGTGPRGISGAG